MQSPSGFTFIPRDRFISIGAVWQSPDSSIAGEVIMKVWVKTPVQTTAKQNKVRTAWNVLVTPITSTVLN